MLYDQAQLAVSYLEAYQITHDAFYAAASPAAFWITCCADMTDKDGGFYSR